MRASSAHAKHGFTMGQLDTIAQYAARNPYTGTSGADGDEMYEAAWGAAVEALCADTERPTAKDLLDVARRAVDATRQRINRDRGVDHAHPWSGTYAANGYMSWWIDPNPGDPVGDRVVDQVAVGQVMRALTPRRRETLKLLALHNGDVAAAAAASGRRSYPSLVVEARRYALGLWHDGETPRYVRVEAGASSRPVVFPCGTRQAYRRHMRRKEQPCEPCRRAHSVHMAGYYQARKMTRNESAA